MYDTIRIRSPYIDDSLFNSIKSVLTLKQGIDIISGRVLYRIITGQLNASYESSISIQYRDYDYNSRGEKVESRPYLIIECSSHKIKKGHNLYDGFNNVKEAIFYVIKTIEKLLDIKLPCWFFWITERVDVAQNYDLGSIDNVHKWFYINQLNSYGRRKVNRFGESGIYISGSTTTLKFYCKGDEFKKHDSKILKFIYSSDELLKMQDIANRILRCELEVKKRKLCYDFKSDEVYVYMLTDEYFVNLFNSELGRFLKDGENVKLVISDALSVKDRLEKNLKSKEAKSVFATWTMLSKFGYDAVKKDMPRRTFYRHVKILRDLAISWHNTDLSVINQDMPHYDLSYDSNIAIDKTLKNII